MANSREHLSSDKLFMKNEELENYFANTIIPQLFVDKNMILRKFTPPAMTHFSLTEADVNRNINEVKDNIRYPTLIENIREVIATSEILEKEIQTTDGKWFQMNILPYKVRKENSTNGVIITFVDITHRIQTLKQLEKLNAEHDTLMFALAHDIRQPISAIVLLADGLLEAYHRQDTKLFEKWIGTLKTTSNTVRSLILDFTDNKTAIPDPEAEEERINIQNIVDDVLTALKVEIYQYNVKIETDFKTTEIKFARNNLRSIVYNLVSNAIKFRDPNRPLNIRISTEKIQGFVILQVKDTGLGIEEENQKKIFIKGARINKNIDGTGMGLYIIRRMLENNAGKVELKSEPGKGSVFSIYFASNYGREKLPAN